MMRQRRRPHPYPGRLSTSWFLMCQYNPGMMRLVCVDDLMMLMRVSDEIDFDKLRCVWSDD